MADADARSCIHTSAAPFGTFVQTSLQTHMHTHTLTHLRHGVYTWTHFRTRESFIKPLCGGWRAYKNFFFTFLPLSQAGSRRDPSTSEGVNKTSKIAAQSLGRRREKRECVWERERGDSEEVSGTSSSLTHNTNHISGSANNEAASASRWSRDSSPAAVLAARNVVINHDLEIIASLSQLIKLSGTHLSSSDGNLDPFITTLFAFFMTAAATPFESCAAFSFLFFFNWEELHV